MISIIEQGFFRRNWGKLALGAGALGYAASQGENMPIPKGDTEGSTKRLFKRSSASATFGGHKFAPTGGSEKTFSGYGIKTKTDAGGNVKTPFSQRADQAVQTGAERAGAATRATIDYGKKTADSFKRGYEGQPNVPLKKLPTIPPPPKETALPSPRPPREQNWSRPGTQENRRPNVPRVYPNQYTT